jgi:V-type H+-transporting ATPase subunit A
MNVGFRPRLKARPSLYDLIKDRNIDRLSILCSTKLVDLGELPALPNSRPSTPIVEKQPELVHSSVKMPPKKEAKADADGEEQYGKLLKICCKEQLS